ncbi:16S rRNA methyltransferase [Marmoricola sp. Leaf446]|uniref:16S rRNA (uracil(1498)-N(3))-methyltransferase n=1 Tax=Marmoricola sp. Leaf446 TaxID=1736379 RepID=UPI0006F87398|nr:16S rRNA (uracil(1498)-N(3))-methyltransferase [Marmoricola sp. Leaf446]KQT94283.1 16S rRNA methyltransferase [Marmoricola sp. Leaf446]
MSLPVFLGPVTDARVGDRVRVEGDEARHAVVVRRTRVGEQVVLTDGEGTAVTGEVVEAQKNAFVVSVTDVRHEDRAAPHVTVVQAVPKGDRGELAVEVLTEVGVDRVVPWAAARCVGVWRGERAEKSLAKWRATAREAGKQSRRAWLPEVRRLAATADVVALLEDADLGVVLHEAADTAFAALPLAVDGVEVGTVVVVVGPEGGLTDEEVATFAAVGGTHVVTVGRSVLRTSTAGVVAVAALLSRTGRWA